MKKLSLESNGKKVTGYVQRLQNQGQDQIWVYHDGEIYCETVVAGAKRKGRASGDNDKSICAPMPGKVTRVLVAKGDHVSPGQTTVVMEAMKMEYNLKAAKNAVVESVSVAVGDQVILGATLIEFTEQDKK